MFHILFRVVVHPVVCRVFARVIRVLTAHIRAGLDKVNVDEVSVDSTGHPSFRCRECFTVWPCDLNSAAMWQCPCGCNESCPTPEQGVTTARLIAEVIGIRRLPRIPNPAEGRVAE